MIESMGGKCSCCGYNKYDGALEFHHVLPKEKDFRFCQIRSNCTAWAKIIQELRKCILICSNCHKEIHAKVRDLPKSFPKFDESYAQYDSYKHQKNYKKTFCPVCGKEKKSYNKTCSIKCHAKSQERINWENIDLYDLRVNKKINWTKLSHKLGVSDNAIRKHFKKMYGKLM